MPDYKFSKDFFVGMCNHVDELEGAHFTDCKSLSILDTILGYKGLFGVMMSGY